MKTSIALLILLIGVLFSSCGPGGAGSSGAATELEGTYIDPDSPDLSFIIRNGTYQQGTAGIHAEGKFTARKINATTWELDVIHTGRLAGKTSTIVVSKQGDYLVVKDKEVAAESKFKRK